MKSNPESQEFEGPREGAQGLGIGLDSSSSRRLFRRCLRWGERTLFSVLMLALLVFTIRMAFTNVAGIAGAESVPLEESSLSGAAQDGEASPRQGLRESDANPRSDSGEPPEEDAPAPVETPSPERGREPDADEARGAKDEKAKERTGKRSGIFRLGGDHASDVETVYREAALVWGLED